MWPIGRTLSGATTPDLSRPGSNYNKGLLYITQSSRITRASQSDCLVSHAGHFLGKSYPSAEVHSVYSTPRTDLDIYEKENLLFKPAVLTLKNYLCLIMPIE